MVNDVVMLLFVRNTKTHLPTIIATILINVPISAFITILELSSHTWLVGGRSR